METLTIVALIFLVGGVGFFGGGLLVPPEIVEVSVYVDKPVYVEVPVYIDRIVEVPVPVEVPVYIDKPVYVDRIVEVEKEQSLIGSFVPGYDYINEQIPDEEIESVEDSIDSMIDWLGGT